MNKKELHSHKESPLNNRMDDSRYAYRDEGDFRRRKDELGPYQQTEKDNV